MYSSSLQERMQKLYTEGFTVLDIAEPLISFDGDKPAQAVRDLMAQLRLTVAGIRVAGQVAGYARREQLQDGLCQQYLQPFSQAQVVQESAPLANVIEKLAATDYCFVSILGSVGAIVSRTDVEKPPVRMWLFGMITILEMHLVNAIEERYPQNRWRDKLSPGRLQKAEALLAERQRRNQTVTLLDCLQFPDKMRILIKDPDWRRDFGFESVRAAEQAIKSVESLRNNLAHAQGIVAYDWETIVAFSKRVNTIISRIS